MKRVCVPTLFCVMLLPLGAGLNHADEPPEYYTHKVLVHHHQNEGFQFLQRGSAAV